MTTTLTNMSCGGCGRPTPYRIVIADEAKPCCGRLSCEAWARDGVRRDHRTSEPVLLAVREERRRWETFLVKVVEGVTICAKIPSAVDSGEAELARCVAKQLRRELLDAIVNGAPEVSA